MMKSIRSYCLLTGLVLLATVMVSCAGNPFRAALTPANPTQSHALVQQQESLIEELRRVLVFSAKQPAAGVATLGDKAIQPDTHNPVVTIPQLHPLLPDKPVAQRTAPSLLPPPLPSTQLVTYHTVAPGDTLGEIALKYMGKFSAWEDVLSANPFLTNPHQLKVGQSLRIPSSTVPGAVMPHNAVVAKDLRTPKAPEGHRVHTVAKGDSLRFLADHYLGEPELWHLLARANPKLAPPYRLTLGQTLLIPTGDAVEATLLAIQAETIPARAVGHTVRSGDTLGAIAQRYLGNAALWATVMDANPTVTDPREIFPGQVLIIPAHIVAGAGPIGTEVPGA